MRKGQGRTRLGEGILLVPLVCPLEARRGRALAGKVAAAGIRGGGGAFRLGLGYRAEAGAEVEDDL